MQVSLLGQELSDLINLRQPSVLVLPGSPQISTRS